MTAVRAVTVAPEEAELRLDRWFRQHYPDQDQSPSHCS